MTADSPRTPVSYGETVKELQDADAALARIVGQARAAEEADEHIARAIQFLPASVDIAATVFHLEVARAALAGAGVCGDPCPEAPDLLPCQLAKGHGERRHRNRSSSWPVAGAGVTDNERTAEGFPPGFVWSDEEQRPVYKGERPVGTGPTAAEHAERIEWSWNRYREEDEYLEAVDDARKSLAALVALAERQREALRELRESLRIEPYRGVKYKLLCHRCEGLGEVGPSNHDDPKSWPCSECEGLGVRPKVLAAIRKADAVLAVWGGR